MKIISPFQDYYDHAVHPSQKDDAIRFIRKTSTVPFDYEGSLGEVRIGESLHYLTKRKELNQEIKEDRFARTGLLTIGAKAYMVIVPCFIDLNETQFPLQRDGFKLRPWGAPSREVYERLMIEWESNDKHNVTIEEIAHKASYWSTRYLLGKGLQVPRDVAVVGQIEFNTTDLCMHYQTPTVLVLNLDDRDSRYGVNKSKKVIVNPPLKAFNMMHVIDPWQAWQEISMWIGGVMPGGQSPMVEVSNTSKIIKAGFDPKISFRKRKES